jgi:hypothetical protein
VYGAAPGQGGGGIEDDVLRPVPRLLRVGPAAGGQYLLSSGKFSTLCSCEYLEGHGSGAFGGIAADYSLSRNFAITGEVSLSSFRAEYPVTENRTEYLRDQGSYMQLDFERMATVEAAFVTLNAFLKWKSPLEGLFLVAGPSVGYLLDGRFEERERMLAPDLVYYDTGTREKTYIEGPFDTIFEAPRIRVSLAGGLGYSLPVSTRISLNPQVTASYPLTRMSGKYKSWNLIAIQAGITLLVAVI